MKKILFTILMVALLIGTAQAGANRFGDTFHNVQIKDETGRNVTDITNLYIYLPGTTTNATIYSDKGRQNTITIPMTEASNNTTLVDGRVHWWGPDLYDFSMTNDDGVGPMTNSGHADRSGNEGTLIFPTYLTSITTSSWLDGESQTLGTGADWVINGGAESGVLKYTPAADDSEIRFGVSGTDKNTSFNVFTGTALGFKLSSSGATHSLTYDGGIVNLNPSSNFAVNIATGTSTGATTIGNSAGGAIALDTDTSITVNADDSYALTVSAGTISLGATGGDLLVDAVDNSLILRGSEAVSDSILIDADVGSIDIDSADNITVDAADDITVTTAGGPFTVAAGGASTGNIVLGAADNIDIDAADDIAIDTAGGPIAVTSIGGDITLDATDKSVNLDGGETAQDAVKLDASAGGGGVTIDAGTLGITMSGAIVKNYAREIEVEAGTSETVLAADSGKVFATTPGVGKTTYTLPTAATGLTYTFIDVSATAADDLWVTAAAGDQINNGTIAKSYVTLGDDSPATVTVVAISAGSWEVIAEVGSWENDNN